MKKVILAIMMALLLPGILSAADSAATGEEGTRMVCVVPGGQFTRIRSGPSKTSAEVDRIHNGDEIVAVTVDNGFVKFLWDGQYRYAAAEFFEIPDGDKYVVQGNGRVAKRAKPNGQRTGWLSPGIKIDVLAWRYDSKGIMWGRVYGGDYVKKEFLEHES